MPQPPLIKLPKGWQSCVKSAVLYAIALAHYSIVTARAWSLKQTADTFLITPATIASWVKRIDDQGANPLLQLREPVNKFPGFVRYIVQRLKTLNPSMGKVKIAETLCRAGPPLGVTTVGRILKEAPQPVPGGCDTEHAHRDRQSSQPCLACRPHGRADIRGILGSVVAVRITPVLAVLLVGGCGYRPPLATRDGH